MTRILTAMALGIVFCSCQSISGSGNIITQTRDLSPFDGVRASGSIDIEIINDPTQSVKVEADDNIIPHIITRVEKGILDVHYKKNMSYRNVNAKVYVSASSLSRVFVSGSGSIISQDAITDNDRIEFKVSGSGDIKASVDAPSIVASVGGSGTITLHGRTKDFNCTIGGSGDLRCQDLLSENTTVKVSGSGTARVFASVNLDARVSGSGDIVYSGNPASPVIHKSGSGSVRMEK